MSKQFLCVFTSDIHVESQHQSIRLLFYMNVLNGYSLLIVSQCSSISHSLLHEVRPPLICCLFYLYSHILGVGLVFTLFLAVSILFIFFAILPLSFHCTFIRHVSLFKANFTLVFFLCGECIYLFYVRWSFQRV